MDFVSLLSQYMDAYAVILGIGITQAIKYFLPDGKGGKWSVTPFMNRFLPFNPLIVGVLTVLTRDVWCLNGSAPLAYDEAVIKGLISGIASAYLYRTAKVTIFGVE